MKKDIPNKIDQLIQTRLEGLEKSPNPEVWNRIEAILDKEESAVPLIPFNWRKIALLTVIVAGSFITGYIVSNKYNKSSEDKNISSSQTHISKKGAFIQNSTKEQLIENKEVSHSEIIAKSESMAEDKSILPSNTIANESAQLDQNSLKSNKHNKSMVVKTNENNNDIIPAFEKKTSRERIRKKKSHTLNTNITALSKASNVDKESSELATLPKKEKNTDEKIYITRNNQLIALEIIGESQVKASEIPLEIVPEEKGTVDLTALKHKEKFASGFFVGPNIGFTLATMYFAKNTTDPIFNNLSTFNASLGYFFGVSGGYDFNKKLGIQSGIQFSRYNFGFVQPDNDDINRGELSIFQFEIPLVMRYKWNFELGRNRNLFTLVALGGLKYSYITKYYMTARLFSNNSNRIAYWHLDKISQDENHQLGYFVGMEANYFFRKNIYFFGGINAVVSSDISQFPIFLNNQLEKPSQLSGMITMGIRYQFNKKRKTTK